jgi:DNA-binding GntR family transcriptional regulator
MVLPNDGQRKSFMEVGRSGQLIASGRARLAREIVTGRYQPGQSVQLREIAEHYELDDESVLETFAELQALGMVNVIGDSSAIIHSPNPKEMQEAYQVRAALEEIAGRTAAPALKGKTTVLQNELNAMRAAVRDGNLDAYAEHDAQFHRGILAASGNDLLLRVWDTLGFDLRIRAAIGKVSKAMPEVVESHQSIVDALEKGRGREAGLLLRNHVETFLEYLKKSDFFPLPEGRWGIAIGDVSGKGIGAALIMASLQASLRAQALHPHLDLPALVGDVNRLVFESSPTNFFASLFYAEYEPATRVLKYVNAGHNPPIVVRTSNGSSKLFHLKSVGMPIGIAADSPFPSRTFQLDTDDVLVAYTDGITEAESRDRKFWGEKRLETVLRSSSHQTAEQIMQAILDKVSVFVNGQAQHDDMTLVVLQVHAGCDVGSSTSD